MNKFPIERTEKFNLVSNKFKNSIPVVCVNPEKVDPQTSIFIFNCGLGGTNSFNIYMNNPFYNSHYFIMYDKMGHGENSNPISQFKKKYLYELNEVVDWAKKKFPNLKIYLLGESWGSAINFLYQQKNSSKINGVINWNMPTAPVSPVKKTAWQNWQFAWREILTLITNINLFLPLEQSNHELLSSNKLLVRAIGMQPTTRNSTRTTLAVWRFMRPAYKFLIRNGNNTNYDFLYVQSGQDALMCKKHISNIERVISKNHYLKIPTGYHILSMEPAESQILYDAIRDFINKK